MKSCEFCGKEGSHAQVNYKKHGRVVICSNFWSGIYKEGQRIIEGTCSEKEERVWSAKTADNTD